MNYDQTSKYIKSFLDLPKGWHYRRGIPATQENVGTALKILDVAWFLGFEIFEAFPGVDGEVAIHCYYGDNIMNCFEFEVDAENDIRIIHELNVKPYPPEISYISVLDLVYEENRSLIYAMAKLGEFYDFVEKLKEYRNYQ